MQMKSFLFLFVIFLISQPIHVWGLECYTCYPSNPHCKDPFDSAKASIEKSTTAKGCIKLIEGKNTTAVTRGFFDSSISELCPKMNACTTGEFKSIKGTACCCDKNLCNTATIKTFTFSILALSLLLNYY